MSQYLLSFAKHNLCGKSNAYLALLWCMYKGVQSKGRYSDHIKLHLTSTDATLLSMDYQRMAVRFKRVLDRRPELEATTPSGFRPLAALQVKNFRGFGALGIDDNGTRLEFSKIKNIFYAPNGGGKTSLCEALEFATTGHIKEADRRKTKIKQYIKRGAEKAELQLTTRDRQPVAKSLAWSSCFIDRNRLQEFSLLGSKDTGSAESDVIATLFGLEELQEVISRFVKPESFNLKGLLRPTKTEAMHAIEAATKSLLEQRRVHRENIGRVNAQVCARLGLGLDQQFAVKARAARLQKLSELKTRKVEILRLARPPFILKFNRIEQAVRVGIRLLQRKRDIDATLLRNVLAVNYRAVYEALQVIAVEKHDSCPACLTPLNQVVEDPFKRASRELAKFGMLDRLAASKVRVEERMIQLAITINTTIAAIDENVHLGVPLPSSLNGIRHELSLFNNGTDRAAAAEKVVSRLVDLMAADEAGMRAYASACDRKWKEFVSASAQSTRLSAEVAHLQELADELKGLFDEKREALAVLKELSTQLSGLAHQRTALKTSEMGNARFNQLVEQLQIEYANLYSDLLAYKLSHERSRIVGIEEKAAEYYKAINNHDCDHERIHGLKFEKDNEAYRIKIADSTGQSLDAFSVLSEGHLRALGLSLLLAMAEKNRLPLIVFDDVVNAIDSDHRSNIIDLLFADPYLRGTQMIITTHDRLFWERFCIIADRHPQADQHRSTVLSYTNMGIVMVDYAGGFQEKVYRALSAYDIRQALIYCRIWFESMVIEYCIDNSVSVTAQFTKSAVKKSIYLQISLGRTFGLVEPVIAYDRTYFEVIKQDLVNWSGQNQEHHAFDESSLNFVHSKTSVEVFRIYDAIRLFECQLFPEKKKTSCNALLEEVTQRIAVHEAGIARLDRAPLEVQHAQQLRLAGLKKRQVELNEELKYVERCLAAVGR
ncbi:hypothetical protein E4L96_17160 [Massilia arenosa]|uniref:RecF/RecN/SMC N-terminal domain-containing protein n=1 Tax=Zemynaea arenosa TaxID=2561931 RepID=A0A4Y9S4D3_9BURK|nr:ATP-binding protein [Massilia arenosa]TFW16044.1 hypothetical protein E4L96_17160 [Massilia arenosa]